MKIREGRVEEMGGLNCSMHVVSDYEASAL